MIMNPVKNLRTFLLEEQFKIQYQNGKLDIVNYREITHFDSNKIIISNDELSISIIGRNLVVSKLLKDELLIEGDLEKIEFR